MAKRPSVSSTTIPGRSGSPLNISQTQAMNMGMGPVATGIKNYNGVVYNVTPIRSSTPKGGPSSFINNVGNGAINMLKDVNNMLNSKGLRGSGGGGGGGSSGGGPGGYAAPAPEPSFDANAYMQMIMNIQNQQMEAMQRAADEQASLYRRNYDEQMAKLRASVGEANTNVDKNAASTIGTMRGETDEQLRQANIARQQAERVQQQSSYLSGAGGASESAMMDVNNTYQNSRDRYNTAFSTSQKDVLGQADNLKATNNQSLTQSEVGMMNNLAKHEADLQNSMAQNQASFASQIPQYALQLASLGPQYAGAVDFNALSAAASKAPRTTYAQLRAQGKSDEEIRKLLGM